MGVIIFNGVSSLEKHIQVQHPPEYVIPERDYEVTHVPGRNGDIVIDNGSWKNVDRIYDIAIDATQGQYPTIVSDVVQWLHSVSGYARLEDSYEPEYFRLALYKESAKISNIFMKAGEVDIVFDCKPQRYLKTGENPIKFTANGKLRNPTSFNASPKIRIIGTGDGAFSIGKYEVTVTGLATEITIDSDLQDAYNGTTNCNSNISLTDFPLLKPGDNTITFSGGITSIEIIPRWWTL